MTKEWGLDEWIQHLEASYGECMIELDDLDKVELLDLLKELKGRRLKDD
jgi:hypothetical protein